MDPLFLDVHFPLAATLYNNLEQQFEKAMQSVSKFFKEENDFLYRRGEARGEAMGEMKGEAKKSQVIVENLILKLGLADEQIADLAEVELAFVKNIRRALSK